MTDNRGFFDLCEKVRFRGDERRWPEAAEMPYRTPEDLQEMISHGLRVSHVLTAEVHRSLVTVTQRLGLDEPPPTYVICDPRIAASSCTLGLRENPTVILSSGIIELMSPAEMQFVLGHELGHFGLGHVAAPFPTEGPSAEEEMRFRYADRCAEISADRIGMLACGSLYTCAMVMLKLATGLSDRHLTLDVRAFLRQLDRPGPEDEFYNELLSTHPNTPLRLRALVAFGKSIVHLRTTRTGGGGMPLTLVDDQIEHILSAFQDDLLARKAEEHTQLASAWLATSVLLEGRRVSRQQQDLLRQHVGGTLAAKTLSFAREFGREAVREKLVAALDEVDADNDAAVAVLAGVLRTFSQTAGVAPEKTQAWHVFPPKLKKRLAGEAGGG
jgi:hypothetical protein